MVCNGGTKRVFINLSLILLSLFLTMSSLLHAQQQLHTLDYRIRLFERREKTRLKVMRWRSKRKLLAKTPLHPTKLIVCQNCTVASPGDLCDICDVWCNERPRRHARSVPSVCVTISECDQKCVHHLLLKELRLELRRRKLPTSGNKDILCRRLETALALEDEFLIEGEDFNPWDAWDKELEPLICRSMPSKAASAVLQSMPSQVSSAESPSKVVSPKKGNLNNGSPEHRQRVTSWHGEEYAQYYFQYFDFRKLQPTLSVDDSRGLLPEEKTFF